MTPHTPAGELTVDELARRVGMTVRNVRAYAARGLLQPPRLVGRTGYYGPAHLARLALIRQLLDEGYTLAAVERLVDRAPADATAAELGVLRAVLTPWLPEEPEELAESTLAERAGAADVGPLLDRLVALGVVEQAGPGRVRLLAPALVAAGLQMVRLGVPAERLLATQRTVATHARAAADAYVRLVRDTVWRGFVAAGMPEQQWAAVQRVVDQAQPLAAQAMLATFRRSMAAAVDAAMGEELARLRPAEQDSA